MTDVLRELESTAKQAEEKGAWRLAGICRRAIAQIDRLRRNRQKGGLSRAAKLTAEERSTSAKHAANARWSK